MRQSIAKELEEFFIESNAIESVFGHEHIDQSKRAWEWAIKVARAWYYPTIGVDNILKIHKKLLRVLNPRIAGQIRTCDVSVGSEFKPFVSVTYLKDRLRDWDMYYKPFFVKFRAHEISKETIEKIIKQAHIEFERIHPFEDGNGRTGRIIYNAQRVACGLPVHIIHRGEEQYEYYKWFKEPFYDFNNTI